MRILVVFAHPLETSFVAKLYTRVVETLRLLQHEVDDLSGVVRSPWAILNVVL
jgi:putative NADPH-quinone reductase